MGKKSTTKPKAEKPAKAAGKSKVPAKNHASKKEVKPAAPEESSEEDDESGSEEASGSGSSGEESGSGSEEEESESEAPAEKSKAASKDKRKHTTTSSAPENGLLPYKPPADFEPLRTSDLPSSNPFSAANLAGKQLWLITAPPGAGPLSALKSVDPSALVTGAPVLERKTGSYSLTVDEDDAGGVVVMAPDSRGNYKAVKQSISRALRLTEVVPPPSTSPEYIKTKPVREQPEGLRMRYRPFGAVDVGGSAEVGDVMDLDEPAEGSQEKHKKKKRSRESIGGEEGKKKKKHRSKDRHQEREVVEVA